MSTRNFKSMNYDMPLIVAPDYDYLAEQYEKVYDEEYTYDQYCEDGDFMHEMACETAEEMNDNLTFHKIEIVLGYYDSFSFYVREIYENQFDLSKNSKYCIDNDEAHYYFDMCRSEALRKADAEKRKIKKWLKSLAENGYWELNCVGVFSNGEAIYERV